MSIAEKENRLIDRYTIIEDRHERLGAIIGGGKKWHGLSEAEKTDDKLVPGCSSRVWLVGEIAGGVCRFRMDADSPLVKGLAALMCELFDGEAPAEIVAAQPRLLEALGLNRMLSPTRLNGAAQIQATIQRFAAAHA